MYCIRIIITSLSTQKMGMMFFPLKTSGGCKLFFVGFLDILCEYTEKYSEIVSQKYQSVLGLQPMQYNTHNVRNTFYLLCTAC